MSGKFINNIKDKFKSFKKTFKKYLSTNILFMSYIILSLLVSLTLRATTVGSVFLLKPLLADAVVITVLGSFGYFFKPKNQFKYFFTLLCIFTFLGIGNSIYYTFYKSFLSISLIDSLKMVGEVENSVFDKLKFIDFVFLLYPISLFIVHKSLNKRKYYFEVEKTEKGKIMFKNTLRASGIIFVMFALMLTGSDLSRFVKQWNREYIVQRFGLYSYTINDVVQSLQPKINTLFGYDAAAREFREFYKEEIKNKSTKSNKYTNVFEGKNIIMIHAESVQNFVIDLTINGREVTPNLNKLAKESLYFSSFYPQISTGTSADTEFTCETGLLPSTSGIAFVSYFDRKFESIPSILSNKGYYTFSMHANNREYWNRNVMHMNLGYKDFYAKESLYVTEENSIGLGLSDKDFFNQIIPLLNNIKQNNKKFFGTIITLTNHSPFDNIDKYGEFDVTMPYSYTDEYGSEIEGTAPYLDGTEMGNYIKSVHYADEALGEFFQLLETNGLLENTVIVLYGDHEAKIGKNQFNLLYNYDPVTNGIIDLEEPGFISFENYKYDLIKNTPLMIWSKDSEYKGKVTDVMGMYDVLPTLANMFNFEYTYAMGHDVFSNNEKIVIFPNGNFITNKVYYNSLRGDYIALTDEPLPEGYIERLKEYSDIRLSVANNLIIHDLIRNEEENLKEELK